MGRGTNPDFLFSITQIGARFIDDLGNVRSILGTGFFLQRSDRSNLFVTNRHNLDPSPRKELKDTHFLESVRLLLRRRRGSRWERETQWVDLDVGASQLLHSDRADVSVILNPAFVSRPSDYEALKAG